MTHSDPAAALRNPRNRMLLIAVGVGIVLLLIIIAVTQGDDSRRAERDLRDANETVVEKQRAVEAAQDRLEEAIAELRAAKAEADLEATRLEGAIDRDRSDERTAGGEVDLVDEYGRPVRVKRP